MATVVLTTVGGALGGPIGAAIGGLAGRAVDGALFGARPRQGPRLNELQVQTSSYGTPIPRLFGTIRVAGTVIWATELRESRSTGGGKGQTTQTYSYSASFAVALSGRPIRAVRRIWAEGKLLRGNAGDWKTRTGFRLYPGDERQGPDPLIASVEGVGMAPAHRSVAYAVFEDLALADFGNRIPSLTFEVEADIGEVAVGMVAATLGNGAIAPGDAGASLLGFAAQGDSIRSAVEDVVSATGGWFGNDGTQVMVRDGGAAARIVHDAGVRDAEGRRRSGWRAAKGSGQRVAVAYHDVARDYQTGMQQSTRSGSDGRILRIDLPAVLSAGDAAALAEAAAARAAVAGEQRTLALDWSAIDLTTGERIVIAGEAGSWRIARWTLEGMVLVVECRRVPERGGSPAGGIAGRAQLAPDLRTGATRLRLIELPLSDRLASRPAVAVLAAGTEAGWRQAALLVGDGTGGWREAGMTGVAAVIGTVVQPPPAGPTTIEDRQAAIEVTLLHDAMTLGDADAQRIDRGANIAMIGDEVIQFGRAERIGVARWRLSRLWRGRRGSEWAVATHAAGEGFALLDMAALRMLDDGDAAIGRGLSVIATGISGDEAASMVPDGRGVVPPSPVHLRAARRPGSVTLHWVRRSRIGWSWDDGIDAPAGEEREAYRVTMIHGDASTVVETAEPRLTIPPPAAAMRIEVRQIGTHGESRAATIMLEPGDMR